MIGHHICNTYTDVLAVRHFRGKCLIVILIFFSKAGGNCAFVIFVIFQKFQHKEENIQHAFQQRWKMSFSYNGNFSKIGGKSLDEITSEGGKTTWNKTFQQKPAKAIGHNQLSLSTLCSLIANFNLPIVSE